MELNYNIIGLHIRQYRKKLHLTQEDLAFQIGTSSAYVSNVERGHKKPSLCKLVEIASILGVTLNDLVYVTFTPNSPQTFPDNAHRLYDIMSLYSPEKQHVLIDNITALMQTISTK